MAVPDLLVEAGYAVAIGLAVGFEREHHDLTRTLEPGDVPEEKQPDAERTWGGSPMGARTMAIIALAGWLAGYLGDRYAALAPLLIAGVLVLVTVQFALAVRGGAPLGMTTEIAAVVVALLGVLVHVNRSMAVPLALATILLLISKPWTRAVMVRGDFVNDDRALRPGMLMEVRLARPERQALVVPEIALVQVGRDTFVYRVKADGSVEQASIEVGARSAGKAELVSGIKAGERIVVDGTGKLRPGSKVVEGGDNAPPTEKSSEAKD